MSIQSLFTRRMNPDSTIGSIRMGCHRTFAKSQKEAERIAADQSHVGDPTELGTFHRDSPHEMVWVHVRGNASNRVVANRALPILAYRSPNGDGTYDSLCLKCFWTAAIGLSGVGLADAENKHVCGRVPALIDIRQSLPTFH